MRKAGYKAILRAHFLKNIKPLNHTSDIKGVRMQKFFLTFIIACFTVLFITEGEAQTKDNELRIVFTVNENDIVPEGIAYDPVEKNFYVSSTYKRKIIKIDASGKASNFTQEAQDGFYGVVGMRVDAKRRLLWAAHGNVGFGMPMKNLDTTHIGFSGINKYDLTTGKLVKTYLLKKPDEQHFLNDLTLDTNGRVYATNTRTQAIYTIDPKKDELELFLQLPDGHFPNGIDITPDNKYLFLTMYADPKGIFGRIDIAAKKFQPIDLPAQWQAGSDGLYFYNNSLIAILPEENSTDTIAQYILDTSMLKVVDAKMLVSGNPLLSQASTGVIVGNQMYFVATSNLQLFRKKYEETQGNVNLRELPPVRIGVVTLH